MLGTGCDKKSFIKAVN